ncbi:uncharacterized protein L203_103227 [Cryptococcus depauperatus CBS 7841]|uniref:BTB domain-containing protein n=1 Tax=Cryptococcus depauperatus CBS 7841 TaxID=1295531 RepID=A0AAJ8JTB3_9TREE
MEDDPKVEENSQHEETKGDIKLIASDGTVFMVHPYCLKSSSRVFCSMLETCDSEVSNEGIVLHDKEIESSSVIRLYLDFVYGNVPTVPDKSWKEFGKVCRLTSRFLIKYDCPPIILAFRLALLEWLADKAIGPHDVFLIASELDNIKLACNALKTSEDWVWPHINSNDIHGSTGVVDCSVMDLHAAPLYMIEGITPKYMLGLLRATEDSKSMSSGDWETIAKSFGECMGCMENEKNG